MSWPDKINLQRVQELAESVTELFVITTENLQRAGNDQKTLKVHRGTCTAISHDRWHYTCLVFSCNKARVDADTQEQDA